MSLQVLNIGATPNDGTGDPLRTAATKINEMFAEIYGEITNVVDGTTTADIQTAIDAADASGDRRVIIPPGTYSASPSQRLVIPPGDYWSISARGARIRPTGTWSASDPVIEIGDSTGITRTNYMRLDGLHVVNNGATVTPAGIELHEMFNSEWYGVLVQEMPNEGITLNEKGYNNNFYSCTIWLNGGHGVLDASSGSLRWVPQWWRGCRFEGNGEHGFHQASDETFFIGCTLQSNATVSASFYDLNVTNGVVECHACQFEHADPPSAAAERTYVNTTGGDLYISGGAFNGNRTASLGHTGFTNGAKATVVGTKFRGMKDPWVATGDIMSFGCTFDNNINSISVSGATPTNFVIMGSQITPTLRSSFIEVQAPLRNVQSSGRVKFDDSIGPQIVQNMIEGGLRKTFDGWFQDDVAANQSAVALTRFSNGAAFPTKAFAIRAGSLVAVWVRSSEARTAGTLTMEVFKNGSATGLTAVLDGTNTTFKLTTQGADLDTHAAGDDYDVRITTDASWAPTTADIRVGIEIEE